MKKRFLKNPKFRNFTIKLVAGAMLFQSTLSFAQPLIEKELLNTFLKRDNHNSYEGDYNMSNQHLTVDPNQTEQTVQSYLEKFTEVNFIKNSSFKKDIETALTQAQEQGRSLIIESQRITYTLLELQMKPGQDFWTVHKNTRNIETNKLQEKFMNRYQQGMLDIYQKDQTFDSQQKSNINEIDKIYDEFFERNLIISNEQDLTIVPTKLDISEYDHLNTEQLLEKALEGRVNLDIILSGYNFEGGKLENITFNVTTTNTDKKAESGVHGSRYEDIKKYKGTYEESNPESITINNETYEINVGHPNQSLFEFDDYLLRFRNGAIFDVIRFADVYYGTDMLSYEINKNEKGEITLNMTINNENKDTFFEQFNTDPDYRRWMVGMNTLHPLIVESLEDLRITEGFDWRTPETEDEMIVNIVNGFINLPVVLSKLEMQNTTGKSNQRLQEIYALTQKDNLTLQDIYNLSFMDSSLKNSIQSFYNNPKTTSYSSVPPELKEEYKLSFILCGLVYGVSDRYGNSSITTSEFDKIMDRGGKMGDFIKYPISNHAEAYINAEKLLRELEEFGLSKGWKISDMREIVKRDSKNAEIILDKMAELAMKYISKNNANDQLNPTSKEQIKTQLKEMRDEPMFFLMYTAAGGRLGLDYSLIPTWKEWDFWTKPEGKKLKEELESLGVNGFYVPEFDLGKITTGVTDLTLKTGKSKLTGTTETMDVITGDLTTRGANDFTQVQLIFNRRQNRDGKQVLTIDDKEDNSYFVDFETQILFDGSVFDKENGQIIENEIKNKEAKNSWVYLYVVNSEGKIVSQEITLADEKGNINYSIDARNIGEVPKEGLSTEYKIYALPFDHEYISLMKPAKEPTLVGKIIIGSTQQIFETPEVNMPSEMQKILVAFTVPTLETGSDLNPYQETADHLKEGLEEITIIANLSTYNQFKGTSAYNNLKTNFIANIEEYLRPLIADIDEADPYTDYELMLDTILSDLDSNNITIDEAYSRLFGRDPINGNPVANPLFEILAGAMVGKASSRVNVRVIPAYTYGAMFSSRAVKSLYSEEGITFYSLNVGFETTEYSAEILGEGGTIIVTSEDIREITNFSEKALTTKAIAEMGFHVVPLKTVITLKALREEILSNLDLESILDNEKNIDKNTRYGAGITVQPLTKSKTIFGKILDRTAIYGGIKFYDENNIERLYGGGMVLITPTKNEEKVKLGLGTHLEYTTPQGVLGGGGYLTISPNMNLNINTPIGKNWGVGADASALAVYNREEINQRHILGLGATGTVGVSIKRKINIGKGSFEIKLRGEYKHSIIKDENPIDQWGIGIEILR